VLSVLVSQIASVRPGRLVKGLTVTALVVAIISAFGVRIKGTVTGLGQLQLSVQGLALHIGWRAWRRDRRFAWFAIARRTSISWPPMWECRT